MKDRTLITAFAAVLALMGAAVVRCEQTLAQAEAVRANFLYLGNGQIRGADGKLADVARMLPTTPVSLLTVLESGESKMRDDKLGPCKLEGRTVVIGGKPAGETLLICEDGRVLVVKGIMFESKYWTVRGQE